MDQHVASVRAGQVRGVLAPAGRLDRMLHIVLLGLVVSCAVRYLLRHDFDAAGKFILIGAAGFVAVYTVGRLLPQTTWVVIVVALWACLTLVAPSFAWTAVPVAFAVLLVLPFRYAAAVVVLMTIVVSAAWLRISDGFDPTMIAGPIGMALVTVIAFRALDREATTRQRLLEELTAAQDQLAREQHRSGVLAERTRLSREIHDSVGQGLTSINLLLQAAQLNWTRTPDAARQHVDTAASTARIGLDEVRRVVRDLAAADLDEGSVDSLHMAIRRILAQAHGIRAELRVFGDPVPVASTVASALVRTVQGTLANTLEHAGASRFVVSLTYTASEVLLDAYDDGRGFEPGSIASAGERGRGLRGIHQRAADLGGRASLESAPGEGTTITVSFGLPALRSAAGSTGDI